MLLRDNREAVAELLWLANSAPPPAFRREFYVMKDKILAEHGRKVGEDLQRIDRPCWGCNGTGQGFDDLNDCYRCDGSGVFETVYVRLERWNLAERIFHRPAGRLFASQVAEQGLTPNIQGRIVHKAVDPADALEACLLLAVMFDRKLLEQLAPEETYTRVLNWYCPDPICT